MAKKCYRLCCGQKGVATKRSGQSDEIQLQAKRVGHQCRNCTARSERGVVSSHLAQAEEWSLVDHQGSGQHIPFWLCVLLLFCYISAGASVFCVYHGQWSFVDSFFFAFTVLWTIGVVDSTNEPVNSNDGIFVLLCTLYLLVGLSILSMCFSLVQESTRFGMNKRLSNCLGINQGSHYTTMKGGQLHSSWVYNEGPS